MKHVVSPLCEKNRFLASDSTAAAYSIHRGIHAAWRHISQFFFILAAICYLPVTLVWTGVIPFAYRFHVLAGVLFSIIGLGLFRGYRWQEVGFTREHSRSALRWNLLFCATGTIGLLLLDRCGVAMPRNHEYSLTCFFIYIAFLGPVQEFIFRGVLFAEMRRCHINHPAMVLCISTVTFCFLHVIYNYPPLLLITFISGLVWGILYLRWPTLWGISLSHSFLGALAMVLGVL